MIELIKGIITLIVLIMQVWGKVDAEKEKKIKELKDAIKSGDTSSITAILSGM